MKLTPDQIAALKMYVPLLGGGIIEYVYNGFTGKKCFAVRVSSPFNLGLTIGEAVPNAEVFSGPKVDNLGYDKVVFWENIEPIDVDGEENPASVGG